MLSEEALTVQKLPPEENGGLMVKTLQELLVSFDQALDTPSCCIDASCTYIDRHMAPVDGSTCKRICDTILEFSAVHP